MGFVLWSPRGHGVAGVPPRATGFFRPFLCPHLPRRTATEVRAPCRAFVGPEDTCWVLGCRAGPCPRHLRWGHVCHVLEVRRRTGRVGHACRRVSRDQLSREASCSGTPTSACFLPTGHGTPVPLRDRHLENVGSGHRSGCGGVDPGPQESRATCTGAFPSHVGSCALARPGFGGPARCWTVLLLGAACR